MSSALTSLVPVLEGPNYQMWAPSMMSYLMSQGQWKILTKACPKPIPAVAATTNTKAVPSNNLAEEIEEWEEIDTKAHGNICLCLHPTLQYKYKSELSAGSLRRALEKDYGAPGVAVIYIKFKGAMETRIPDNLDPTFALDKINAHFGRLAELDVDIPEHLQAMILLSKLPSSMDSLAQMMCQVDSPTELGLAKVRRSIILTWEQHRGGKKNQQQPQAQRLSAVKQPQGQQTFCQQLSNQAGPSNQRQEEFVQRDGQGGNWREGRGGQGHFRGNRAGKKKQGQAQNLEFETAPPSPVQDQFEFRHIAQPIFLSPPLSLPQQEPTPPNTYPTFRKALSLAKCLGVKPSIETIKTLETAEIARSQDPRPRKRA